MTDFFNRVRERFLGQQYGIQHRLLNLILLAAAIGGTLSFFITLFVGSNMEGIIIIMLLLLTAIISLWFSAYRNNPKVAGILVTGLANMVIFPIMFIYQGGIMGGMPVWIVLGLIFSWLILRGRSFYVMFILNFFAICAVFHVQAVRPELIQHFSTDLGAYVDCLQGIMATSIIIGAIFKYQTHEYEKQKAEIMARDEEIKEAMVRLEKANQAKSDFLANMSHEIRTPINAIMGMDEMILRENTNKEIRDYASNIKSASQSLLSLINDILDFSKIESGKMELVISEYDTFSLLNDCYSMILLRAADKGLKLNVKAAENVPARFRGDESRVRQIISNILTNAVKYTDRGEINLSVSWEPYENGPAEDGSDGLLVVAVRDTGRGISAENLDKLFVSFQRIDEAHSRNIEGTGLGLTITKNLLDLMGGTIDVRSAIRRGSTFTVKIPQVVIGDSCMGNFDELYKEKIIDTEKYRESFRAPKANILVVDDVRMNLEVVKHLLKQTQVNIHTADGGLQCLEMSGHNKYDIIFMDHMMPELDGVQTLKLLQKREDSALDGYKLPPVIMMTANAIIGAQEEYLSQGFVDYISKPVRGQDLEDMVRKYLPPSMIEKVVEAETDEAADTSSAHADAGRGGAELEKAGEMTAEASEAATVISRLDFLDVETGLSYAMDEPEFYLETIESYMKNNLCAKLEKNFALKRWAEYRIHAHSLKSTSLTIGAKELSEAAKGLEDACREENETYILRNHVATMNLYRQLMSKINEATGFE